MLHSDHLTDPNNGDAVMTAWRYWHLLALLDEAYARLDRARAILDYKTMGRIVYGTIPDIERRLKKVS